jgi:hypothetical protein
MKVILGCILIMFTGLFTSCKKCTSCSQMCYRCVLGNYADTICAGGIVTAQLFQQQLQVQEQQLGYTCTQIQSSHIYQYCDPNQSMTTYLENSGLSCK